MRKFKFYRGKPPALGEPAKEKELFAELYFDDDSETGELLPRAVKINFLSIPGFIPKNNVDLN